MKVILLFTVFMTTVFSAQSQDWPNLSKFRDADSALGSPSPGEKRIVFMGNSITEGWINADPEFFKTNNLINRGISGQTTPQMLLRFRQDVIDLKPAAVLILAGINDIAGNTGPSTLKMIKDNFESMAELAHAAGISVYLCSLLPTNRIPWRDNVNESKKVMELNAWLRNYAASNDFEYIDYFSSLKDADNGLPARFSKDGVHPNLDGYKIMEQLVTPVISGVRK